MSFRAHFHHLSDLLEDRVAIDWRKDWPYLLILGVITALTGPLYLFGTWIQQWNVQTNPWDGKSRWDGTREFAYTLAFFDLLLVVAIIHFYPQLSVRWSASLGSWLFYHIAIWYVFCALLAPTFALIAERIDPRKRKMRRVRSPSERPAPIEESVTQPARKKRTVTTGQGNTTSATAPKKRKKGQPIPMGELLQREQEERERRRTQIVFVQAPLLTEGTPAPDDPSEAPVGPPKAEKPERRKPEPLDNLF